jgi:hypothetical protein
MEGNRGRGEEAYLEEGFGRECICESDERGIAAIIDLFPDVEGRSVGVLIALHSADLYAKLELLGKSRGNQPTAMNHSLQAELISTQPKYTKENERLTARWSRWVGGYAVGQGGPTRTHNLSVSTPAPKK